MHINHGQIDDVAPSDDTSYSTSPGADESKFRPRPKRSLASFASYLGTHNRTVYPRTRPEWPSIDWSNLNGLNDKDGVYKPDTELMCTTVMRQVLGNPSADLPAQYNTLLLHLIEAYQQSRADLQELQMKLAEVAKCKQNTVNEFHGSIAREPLENSHMLQSVESADSNTLYLTRPGKQAIGAILRKESSPAHTNISGVDRKTNGQQHRKEDKTRTSEHHSLMSSARRYCEASTADVAAESNHDRWLPSSPQHDMELTIGDTPSWEGEEGGRPVLMSASDVLSGLEDDVASRVAWLALPLKIQPGSKLSELLQSAQKGLQQGLIVNTVGTLRPNMPKASESKLSSGDNQILSGQPNTLMETDNYLSFHSIRTLGHHRGFSHLIGDDSANPILCNAFSDGDNDSKSNSVLPLARQDKKHSGRDSSGELLQGTLPSGVSSPSRSQQRITKSIVSPTVEPTLSRNPQRDGSGKRFLTTIISSSSRSSSPSHRGSLNSSTDNESLREDSVRRGESYLAVAAARTAKNGK